MPPKPTKTDKPIFKKQANIGAADAINDVFLSECFVDKGDLDILLDTSDHRCIVVGRTGTGKTALIQKLCEDKERTLKIDLADLALNFISNNNVLKYFAENGVQLSPFYRLLWKHVFITEIIKLHYKIHDEARREGFIRQITDILGRNKNKKEAIEYLFEWGDKFWETTEYRVKQIIGKVIKDLESSVNGGVNGGIPGSLKASTEAGIKERLESSEEYVTEVIHRGQKIINDIQVSKLQRVIEILAEEILTDRQKIYYIAIDKLDDDWVDDDKLRYRLIFELITTINDLNNKLSNVKIVIVLREDLLYRVFSEARGPGFQEEKIKDMYLSIKWSRDQLKDLLSQRVNYLFKRQYTNRPVSLDEILPPRNIKGQSPLTYILERTMLTPREAIHFFNKYMELIAYGDRIKPETVAMAESKFSSDRLYALKDEWYVDYPNLEHLCRAFEGFPTKFRLADLNDERKQILLDRIINISLEHNDKITELLNQYSSSPTMHVNALIEELSRILYRVGVLGFSNMSETYHINWSYKDARLPNSSLFSLDIFLHIHPAFWSVLKIQDLL